jgi:hypothetical protein
MLIEDCRWFWHRSKWLWERVVSPPDDIQVWIPIAMRFPVRWNEEAKALLVSSSSCEIADTEVFPRAFTPCHLCGVLLADGNSMTMHLQKRHNYKAHYSSFAHADGQCKLCLRMFHCRIRLKAHLLSGVRKGPAGCAGQMTLQSYPRNTDHADLDAADAACVSAARRAGNVCVHDMRAMQKSAGVHALFVYGPLGRSFYHRDC